MVWFLLDGKLKKGYILKAIEEPVTKSLYGRNFYCLGKLGRSISNTPQSEEYQVGDWKLTIFKELEILTLKRDGEGTYYCYNKEGRYSMLKDGKTLLDATSEEVFFNRVKELFVEVLFKAAV